MIPSRNEHTIAASCSVSGRGYWSGKEVSVTIHPGPAGTGVRLVRTDLPSQPDCHAVVAHRVDASLRTNLSCGEARFELVEHLLAALYALEIDNCVVEISAEELPGLDGSSQAFVQALRGAGLVPQAQTRRTLTIAKTIRIGDSSGWIEATPSRNGKASFEYQLSFDGPSPIRNQGYRVELTPRRFAREIAPARTFVTFQQAEEIRRSGAAAHVTNQELLVIGESGPVENEYRFTNECARHKTLDLIGDLALAGIDLIGNFVSFRGGHQLNGQMANCLAELAHTQTNSDRSAAPHRPAA